MGTPLDAKDQPILLTAIYDQAGYLLTGDARPFGHLNGKRIEGVQVVRPRQYFERRRGRERTAFALIFCPALSLCFYD